jgi:CRP-like cAMP-binding protein
MIAMAQSSTDSTMDFKIDAAQRRVEKLAALSRLAIIEEAIAADFEWFSLSGGQLLFSQGDTDDSLYVVLTGRLRAFHQHKDIQIRQMRVGETWAKWRLLSGEPRSAAARPTRDINNAFEKTVLR